MIPDINEQIQFILFSFFCFSFLLQLIVLLVVYGKSSFAKLVVPLPSSFPPTSIIICARNEDDNLVAFLPSVLNQDYPEFEVVVVNDCSHDNTGDVLDEFAKKNKRLRIVTIKEDEDNPHGKKVALMIGIKGARYEHLLFTDADCVPSSNQWLKHMASRFDSTKEIVIGYGAYEKRNGFLNKIIRFDTSIIALQFFSFALLDKTYMGVGRNLAYKKALFFKHKGFARHYHVESGDDDLFVNEAATKDNVAVELHLDSFTISRVKRTWKGWREQKVRHLSTAHYYKNNHKWSLGIIASANYLFFFSLLLAIPALQFLYPLICLVIIRYITQFCVFYRGFGRLNEKDLVILAPVYELVLLFVYPIFIFSNLFIKRSKWKN